MLPWNHRLEVSQCYLKTPGWRWLHVTCRPQAGGVSMLPWDPRLEMSPCYLKTPGWRCLNPRLEVTPCYLKIPGWRWLRVTFRPQAWGVKMLPWDPRLGVSQYYLETPGWRCLNVTFRPQAGGVSRRLNITWNKSTIIGCYQYKFKFYINQSVLRKFKWAT